MASLGGLDVAYGSNLQLVRTNVLIIETDATTTKAMAENVHSVASASTLRLFAQISLASSLTATLTQPDTQSL